MYHGDMSQRKETLAVGELYHIYNMGVDKRVIFADKQDFFQFLQMLEYFNQEVALGGLKESKYPKNIKHRGKASVLVEIIAYCLNGNHYHLILKQVADDGISKFMQKVGTGYAMYFNKKYKRRGSLFSGKFKSKHIDTDGYLRHVGVYVNLNNRVHKREKRKHGGLASVLEKEGNIEYVSSWNEYLGKSQLKLCKTDYLLHEFKDRESYKRYAESTLKEIIKNKEEMKKLEESGN